MAKCPCGRSLWAASEEIRGMCATCTGKMRKQRLESKQAEEDRLPFNLTPNELQSAMPHFNVIARGISNTLMAFLLCVEVL